jgi:hypothetical protein
MITNVDVYFAIAEEAEAEAERLENLARRPNPDGGFIITYDPERKSFKKSLIAVIFAGICLESFLYIAGVKQFGREEYNKKYESKSYKEKLQLFGVTDESLLAEAEHFRKMRRDLVHEKAVEFGGLRADAIHVAQHEAKKSGFLRQERCRETGDGMILRGRRMRAVPIR